MRSSATGLMECHHYARTGQVGPVKVVPLARRTIATERLLNMFVFATISQNQSNRRDAQTGVFCGQNLTVLNFSSMWQQFPLSANFLASLHLNCQESILKYALKFPL